MKAYIYNVETKEVVAVISGDDQNKVEAAAFIYGDEYGMTYSPAFGSVDGLIDTGEHEEIEV